MLLGCVAIEAASDGLPVVTVEPFVGVSPVGAVSAREIEN